jgi:hypothetical protein
MSENNRPTIWVNTAPRENRRQDGTSFWTVLVGVTQTVLASNNITERVDVITMNIFPNEVEQFKSDFALAKQAGLKLIVTGDEVIVTEPKVNTYTNRDGNLVSQMQASCWATSPVRDVVSAESRIGDKLSALREQGTTPTENDNTKRF